MSWNVIKQPSGKLAIWDTRVDDFIAINLTPADVKSMWLMDAAQRAELAAEQACTRALAVGTSSYRGSPTTGTSEFSEWYYLLSRVRIHHGEERQHEIETDAHDND